MGIPTPIKLATAAFHGLLFACGRMDTFVRPQEVLHAFTANQVVARCEYDWEAVLLVFAVLLSVVTLADEVASTARWSGCRSKVVCEKGLR